MIAINDNTLDISTEQTEICYCLIEYYYKRFMMEQYIFEADNSTAKNNTKKDSILTKMINSIKRLFQIIRNGIKKFFNHFSKKGKSRNKLNETIRAGGSKCQDVADAFRELKNVTKEKITASQIKKTKTKTNESNESVVDENINGQRHDSSDITTNRSDESIFKNKEDHEANHRRIMQNNERILTSLGVITGTLGIVSDSPILTSAGMVLDLYSLFRTYDIGEELFIFLKNITLEKLPQANSVIMVIDKLDMCISRSIDKLITQISDHEKMDISMEKVLISKDNDDIIKKLSKFTDEIPNCRKRLKSSYDVSNARKLDTKIMAETLYFVAAMDEQEQRLNSILEKWNSNFMKLSSLLETIHKKYDEKQSADIVHYLKNISKKAFLMTSSLYVIKNFDNDIRYTLALAATEKELPKVGG